MIQPARLSALNARRERPGGDYVLLWMQASPRAEVNHALEYAARRANALNRPLVAVYGLTPDFPEANARHYAFLLEGLAETRGALERRGVRLVVRPGSPAEAAIAMSRRACLAVVDAGYLRVEKRWRAEAARALDIPLVRVETNVVVPVRAASSREAWSAATLRPRIHRLLGEYLVPLRTTPLRRSSLRLDLDIESLDLSDPARLLGRLPIDRTAAPVSEFRGGTSQARRRLRRFIAGGLHDYAVLRNDPATDAQSGLSPYLHFGQVSPLAIALEVLKASPEGRAPFLEELIVRRELAMNFVEFDRRYDAWEGLPEWARETLERHARDPRPARYSFRELEEARTADPYWNAAQREMTARGKMHGYMRMYWGKRLLEWTATPREAFRTALRLHNRWSLDARDPNGFSGVAWCFGRHDRPWPERPVFGNVRAMTPGGLERKFDMAAYVRRVEALAAPRGHAMLKSTFKE